MMKTGIETQVYARELYKGCSLYPFSIPNSDNSLMRMHYMVAQVNSVIADVELYNIEAKTTYVLYNGIVTSGSRD